jgi:formate-dependent nitrite reductase membrane component NrfD
MQIDMDKLLLSVIIGLVAGIVDIIPMIVRKLPKYSTISAFFHYFFISIVIVNIDLPHIPWWLEGGVISFALMIPMLIHVGHTDKKPLPIIAANSIIIGTLVGIAGHYLS